MVVAVQLDFRGTTLDRYDEVNERIGLLPGGPASREELFHWVTKTDDGFRVTDVWESRDAFEKFAHEKLGPLLHDVGIANPPEIQFFDVYNYFAGQRRTN